MLRLPLGAVTKAEVDALLSDQTPEGRSLDYKRALKLATDDEKREFAKDVSSFANAAGGFLVFGIEEKKDETRKSGLGYPETILGVECQNWDATKQRIESIIRDRLDPRVQGVEIHKVDGYDLGPVVILYIPKSWNGPHMLNFGKTHFYSRNSAGVHPLDVREIGHAFRAGADRAEALRRFRDGRLGSFLAYETPVPLSGGEPKLVVHVCPLDPYDAESAKGFADPSGMKPPDGGLGWDHRFNLDGFLTYAGSGDGPKRAYVLALRNGSFEVAANVHGDATERTLAGALLEKQILYSVSLCARLSGARGYTGPLSAMVALVDVWNRRIFKDTRSENFLHVHDRIDRSTLVLPDVLLETPNVVITEALKPLLDALWQSSGWDGSPFYDAQTKQRTHDAPLGNLR